MKIENQVLKLLKENARYSNEEIASLVGVSADEVKTTIANLERAGIIIKYSAIVNTEPMQEKKVQALIEVKVAPQKLKGFDSYAEEIYQFDEVISLYLMSGGFDLAIFVEGKDISDIAKFIAEKLSVIDGITSVQTHFLLKKYKIEGHIANPSKEHERVVVQA